MAIINARNPNEKFDYVEMESKSLKIAKSLKFLNLQRGKIVHILMQNNIDYFLPCFAAWFCGGVVSLINPNSTPESLANQFKATKTKIIIGMQSTRNSIEKALNLCDFNEEIHVITHGHSEGK